MALSDQGKTVPWQFPSPRDSDMKKKEMGGEDDVPYDTVPPRDWGAGGEGHYRGMSDAK